MKTSTEIILRLLPIIPLIIGLLIIVIRQIRHQKWQNKHDEFMNKHNSRMIDLQEKMFEQKYGHKFDDFDKY